MTAKKTGIIVGVVAAAGIAAAAFAGAGGHLPISQRGPSLALTKISTAPIFQPPPGAPMSFADIFERVSPAVVSIEVETKVSGGGAGGVGLEDFDGLPPGMLPFLQIPRGGRGQPAPERTETSAGSGFFISADGYIATNNHVVENASKIEVILTDKRRLTAEIVGRDESTDLAVVKVQGGNFPFVNFENASKPRVGDWVITIGNPFGLGGTATAGIVSAYGRDIQDATSQFVDFIQIDAPINRGNSGGPTFDIYGRVIGINSVIFSPTGGSVGIGFAIPAEIAESVTKSLIAGGRVTRGYLGIEMGTLDEDTAEALGLKGRKGVLVNLAVEGGPALAAGVQQGDIIVALNDRPVTTGNELTRMVAASRSGDNLKLEVLRDGRSRTINVRSGVRPGQRELAGSAEGGPSAAQPQETPGAFSLGMRTRNLDEATRRALGIEADARGVAIVEVQPGSDAADKGLRRGDLIISVNNRTVTSPEEIATAVDAARKQNRTSVLLFISRSDQGRRRTAPITLKIGD